jgi:hypothetical protein
MHAEFPKDPVQAMAHRFRTEIQYDRHLLVRPAFGHLGKHTPFAGCQGINAHPLAVTPSYRCFICNSSDTHRISYVTKLFANSNDTTSKTTLETHC